MENKKFLKALELINSHLLGLDVKCAYNSIGSNIFVNFGRENEFTFPNGKKDTKFEWRIWIGDASWRLTRNNQYLIGSGEDPEISIHDFIQKLLTKRLESLKFLSQFLDIELSFEDDYKITTFFNWFGENQWCIFLPNYPEISVDCETKEAIASLQRLSKEVEVQSKYQVFDQSLIVMITDVVYDKNNGVQLIGTNDFLFDLGASGWRLEKNGEYLFGQTDYYFRKEEGRDKAFKAKLSKLIGEKIKNIEIDHSGMDVKVQLDSEYILETFTDNATFPWKIIYKEKKILSPRNLRDCEK